MKISFFEILANFDVVFISEELKIEKIGDNSRAVQISNKIFHRINGC